LTLQSIRFNFAWKILREVTQFCVFLIPFFERQRPGSNSPALIASRADLIMGWGFTAQPKSFLVPMPMFLSTAHSAMRVWRLKRTSWGSPNGKTTTTTIGQCNTTGGKKIPRPSAAVALWHHWYIECPLRLLSKRLLSMFDKFMKIRINGGQKPVKG
jgi:hypothetical protein